MTLIIFDKDGTLVQDCGNRPPNTPDEQFLLPGVYLKCQHLLKLGHILAVASNQGGVAFGFMSDAEAQKIVRHAADLIGAQIWNYCPHHPNGNNEFAQVCECRKPGPKMILDIIKVAREVYKLDFKEIVFVGDQETDRQAAEAAGVQFQWADDFFASWKQIHANRWMAAADKTNAENPNYVHEQAPPGIKCSTCWDTGLCAECFGEYPDSCPAICRDGRCNCQKERK